MTRKTGGHELIVHGSADAERDDGRGDATRPGVDR